MSIETASNPILPFPGAQRLLDDAGCSRDTVLYPIAGGGNNRVYRVMDGSRTFLLKEYFSHPEDRRDRLGGEFGFARFAWQSGIRCIPEPIVCDGDGRVALYAFVDGQKIMADDLGASDICQAIDFIQALNSHRNTAAARSISAGSEACFSLSQHLATVSNRLERLRRLAPVSAIERQALSFVEDELSPVYRKVSAAILDAAGAERISADRELLPDEQLISPSDFGFHNALKREDGTIVFLDFEYAGWDDPAKLTGDFFSQVAVPVPLIHKPYVLEAIAAIFPAAGTTLRRMQLLLPLYRIKWCCIILNHFLAVDANRRAFAQASSWQQKAEQLDKARKLLSTIDQLSN